MDFKRQLRTSYVIIYFLCCSALLAGQEAEETVPTPGGQSQNQPGQHEPQHNQDVPSAKDEKEAVQAVPKTDTRQQAPTETDPQTKDPLSQPAVTSDDDTAKSTPGSSETAPAPTAPSGTDGQQHSPTQKDHIKPKAEQAEPRHNAGQGGATKPATPSGGGTVHQRDAQLDSASPSGESSEPQTPNAEEVPGGDTKPSVTDSEPPATTQEDTQKTETTQETKPQQQEEVKADEEVKEGVEGGEEKPPVTTDETTGHDTGNVAEDKMPSFDEWKQKMLAEQAQQAKQAKQEKIDAQAFQPVSGSVAKPKSKSGSRVNYASMSCGAKLIAANAEAKNSGFILTENKDQYMIQPCHAKKWFVVELCEPVAVQSIEMANLELFSSLPESFIVYTSERYPTKEWKTLGTFRARDERAVQSFPVVDEEMFAKYIKVQPLTHYGVEHYCPLTILRVFGTTAVEDYEESDQVDTSGEDDPLDTGEPPKEPSNLFTSATDTVLSLVKTVLSPGEKEKEDEAKLKGVIQMNGTALNHSTVNATTPPPEGEQTAPCTPTAPTGEAAPPKDNQLHGTIQPKTPAVSDHPPLVTLIESRPHADTVPYLLNHCNFCQSTNQPTCYSNRHHICGYYRTTNFVLGTTCANTTGKRIHKVEKLQELQKPFKPSGVKLDAKPVPSENSGQKSQQKSETPIKKSEGTKDKVPHHKTNVNQGKPTAAVKVAPDRAGTPTSSPTNLEPSQAGYPEGQTRGSQVDVSMSKTPAIVGTAKDTKAAQTSVPRPSEDIQPPQSNPPTSVSCDSSVSDCNTMGPDVVQIRPTTTEEATRLDVPEATSEQISNQAKIVPTKTAEPIDPSKTVGAQTANGGTAENNTGVGPNGKDRVIYAETSNDNDYDLDMVPPPEDGEPYQKLSSGRRETAFMRLRNRIKALELNLNLSSRYLEELSQRYRRQMENMYLSLNKTIQKLTNTSRTAEQRDLRQQANITELTKRINFLTEQTALLTDNLNNIHSQVIERHLFLMMIEGMVFMLIITWLLNHMQRPPARIREPPPPVNKTKSALSASTTQTGLRPIEQHTKPPDKAKKAVNKLHKRRNSIDATPPRPKAPSIVSKQRSKDDIGLRLSGSESSFGTDVLNSVAATTTANSEFKEIVNRKKKKKKQNKVMQTSQSSSSLVNNNANSLHQSNSATRVHHKVGLIFSSKSHSQDGSPPNSATSSESGDSATNHSTSNSHIVGSTNFRHGKHSARRSLDLREMQKASGTGGNNNRKGHKRQKSDGSIPEYRNHRFITNIGPTHNTAKVSNGKAAPVQNGGSPTEQPSTWKGWLLGSRK